MSARKNIRVELNYEELTLLYNHIELDYEEQEEGSAIDAVIKKIEAARAKLDPERYKKERG